MRLHYGTPWLEMSPLHQERWLNQSLRSDSADVAISAAWLCGLLDVKIEKPFQSINAQARLVLKEQGLIPRANASDCGIQHAIAETTGHNIPIQWKKFFGKAYKRAEAQAITCKAYFKTNSSAWTNSMDVFVDLLLDALYRKDKSLGIYQLGNVGGVAKSPALKASYTAVFELLNQIHTKRSESDLSHAITKATKRATKPIKFKWLTTGARFLRKAANELQTKDITNAISGISGQTMTASRHIDESGDVASFSPEERGGSRWLVLSAVVFKSQYRCPAHA